MMTLDTFLPENIDLRAIKLEEAFAEKAEAFYDNFDAEGEMKLSADYFLQGNEKIEWFDVPSDKLGGKTPRAFITENYGEKPDFEASLELVKPYIYDDNYEVPSELRDMLLEHKETLLSWTADFVDTLSENVSDDVDYQNAFGSVYTLVAEVYDEKIARKSLELYKKLDYKKYEFCCEAIGLYLATTEQGVSDIIEYLNSSEAITEKEFSLLSLASGSIFHSDDLYRTIRSCCKKAPEDLMPEILYCFEDYGDQRAVSYLRTIAKKYRELWLSGFNVEKNKEIYFSAISIIEKLGGNIDDIDQ